MGTLTHREDGVELRLDDSWIETTGAALEAGGGDEAELVDLARRERFSVQFWDANATKALHVGHLRNLAIGNALAAALEQAGAEVERRSIISDAGRSMGEAMAGIIRSGHHTSAWPEGDQKSDHFVGLCYADYVAAGGFSEEGIDEREDSLTRELRMQNDAADELLKRVMAGEGEALELWFKTRAWVISGQRKTLARLGVAFDRVFFESDFLEEGSALTERGLREGTLTRREDGVVLYATGVAGDAGDAAAARRRTEHPAHARRLLLDGRPRPRGRDDDPDHRHRVGRALDLHPPADGASSAVPQTGRRAQRRAPRGPRTAT